MTQTGLYRSAGFGVCQLGYLRGHDADERRATKTTNGRIACVTCGTFGTDISYESLRKLENQPPLVKDIILALVEGGEELETARAVHFTEGQGFGACLAGHGPDDLLTSIGLIYEDNVRVSISYMGAELPSAVDAEPLTGSTTRENIKGRVPEVVDIVLRKLTDLGFSFLHANTDRMMCNFTLVKGRRIPGKSTILGVRADITWIAD